MPDDRYHHQSALWASVSGAESIMPLLSCDETLVVGDLVVTVPAGVVVAALALPIVAMTDASQAPAAAALATACVTAVRRTHVSYQRIRRLVSDGRRSAPSKVP
ncbi:hypothetical protein ACFY0R_25870 [Streptomyces sp. NPDC001633]|uniref:hypothetical protein n=1 Tax=Streptomyces sp. NPDC001633 TaxID=3364595 RepID=UPI003677F5B7